MKSNVISLIGLLFLIAGCGETKTIDATIVPPTDPSTDASTLAIEGSATEEPDLQIEVDWSAKAESDEWTSFTLAAIDEIGSALLVSEPSDIDTFCPAYVDRDQDGRRAFWVSLLSAMARLESNFDPAVSYNEKENCTYPGCKDEFTTQDGRPVVSRGLLQLSQESANGYRNCSVPITNEELLHDPKVNLRCAVAIMARWVEADGKISQTEPPWLGGARYWSVLRRQNKVDTISAFTRSTSNCTL